MLVLWILAQIPSSNRTNLTQVGLHFSIYLRDRNVMLRFTPHCLVVLGR